MEASQDQHKAGYAAALRDLAKNSNDPFDKLKYSAAASLAKPSMLDVGKVMHIKYDNFLNFFLSRV